MCLILFSYQPDTEAPLILGANRDEFFNRPTLPVDFWEDAPELLAGRDLQAGGTWLGITRSGRFAVITNVREPNAAVENPSSRGELTRNFLLGDSSPEEYLQQIAKKSQNYAGFNLIVGTFGGARSSLYYFSNRQPEITALSSGTYGLSNHLLDTPWPKVNDGKAVLRQKLDSTKGNHNAIRNLLECPVTAGDDRLPSTGVGYKTEKALSAIFISSLKDYGTRATSVLTINRHNIKFCEQNYGASADGKPN